MRVRVCVCLSVWVSARWPPFESLRLVRLALRCVNSRTPQHAQHTHTLTQAHTKHTLTTIYTISSQSDSDIYSYSHCHMLFMPRHNTNTKPETRDRRTETGNQTKNLAHTERNVRLLRHMYYVMWLANGTLVASAKCRAYLYWFILYPIDQGTQFTPKPHSRMSKPGSRIEP